MAEEGEKGEEGEDEEGEEEAEEEAEEQATEGKYASQGQCTRPISRRRPMGELGD